jgi:predicted CoA-binding protein
MPSPLSQVRPVVANLELLIAARAGVMGLGQHVRASLAHLREQIDDVVDAFRREQRTMRAATALLPATFTP